MSADIIDGNSVAGMLADKVTSHVRWLKEQKSVVPGLAVVLVGDDPASNIYVSRKVKKTAETGISSFEHRLPSDVTEQALLDLIGKLNNDDKVHGILVQLPLPAHISSDSVINAISPQKDVDGFHIHNAGLLSVGQDAMIPCTPLGCLLLLRQYCKDMAGSHAVIIGRSNIVGKPMAQLLLKESCTVTVVHSRTRNIEQVVALGDIVVAAVGRPNIVKSTWVKPGAVVIDVGINRIISHDGTSKITGDVDFEDVSKVASAITPVPGGVGPMTIACLLSNTLSACCRIHNISEMKIELG